MGFPVSHLLLSCSFLCTLPLIRIVTHVVGDVCARVCAGVQWMGDEIFIRVYVNALQVMLVCVLSDCVSVAADASASSITAAF